MAAIGLAWASQASAVAPQAGEMACLQAELAAAPAVQVTGTFGMRRLREVRVDSMGVSARRWGPGTVTRATLLASREVTPPPTPGLIAWDEISRIDVGHTRTARTAASLGIAGALLGTLLWHTVPLGYDGGRGPAVVVIGVPAVTGLALGALLGSQSWRWRPVYSRADRTP